MLVSAQFPPLKHTPRARYQTLAMKQLLEEPRAGVQEDTGGMPRLQKPETVTARMVLGQDCSLQRWFPQSSRREGALNAGDHC